MVEAPLQYVLSAREYDLLLRFIHKKDRQSKQTSSSNLLRRPATSRDFNAAAFRSAFRLYMITKYGLKTWEAISARIFRRTAASTTVIKRVYLSGNTKLALAASSCLFFFRIIFGFLTRLRLKLLHEKAKEIQSRYPKLFTALTSKVAPAVGASLAGLLLGIAPADQLRITVAIYTVSRSLEILYNSLDAQGYFTKKPKWMGSWMINALAQGQLLHSFVFDNDCFPQSYGSFILGHTPDYIQRRPANISSKVPWPNPNQIVGALRDMATENWPPYVSPLLHPNAKQPLPAGIDSIITPITSRAHPAIQNLSCALLHPQQQSCFEAYLQQNLKAFPKMARFFALYYGAFSLIRYKSWIKQPVTTANRLAAQILKTTASIAGAIGASWGSICLFQILFPRTFLPRFRFVLGGLFGGTFAILDKGSAGHTNNLYAARTSVDSLWKVGVKHGWWRGFEGGDVLLFTAAWALLGTVWELERVEGAEKVRSKLIVRLLTGEADLGLTNKDIASDNPDKAEKQD